MICIVTCINSDKYKNILLNLLSSFSYSLEEDNKNWDQTKQLTDFPMLKFLLPTLTAALFEEIVWVNNL